jgi:periplasmic protein TonB
MKSMFSFAYALLSANPCSKPSRASVPSRTAPAQRQCSESGRRLHTKLALAGLLLAGTAAQAQFAMVPSPLCPPPRESTHDVEQEYRIDAARHLYACYPMRVFRGKLPPLLYGIAIVEIELDTQGKVLAVEITRKPAADEVVPWIMAMIRRAAPFPAPSRFPEGKLRFKETFFVDKSGLFQAFTLTEGQR